MSPLFLILIVVIFYVVVMIPQNRRRKQTQTMQRSIAPGARIVTTSGIYGTVVEVDDESFILEVDDDVQVRFVKSALMRVLPDTVDTVDADDTVDTVDADDTVDGADADERLDTKADADTPVAGTPAEGIPGPDAAKPAAEKPQSPMPDAAKPDAAPGATPEVPAGQAGHDGRA